MKIQCTNKNSKQTREVLRLIAMRIGGRLVVDGGRLEVVK